MKKIIKWIVIVFILFLLVIISIPFIFKGKIVKIAKEEINKNVNAKVNFGKFDLTIFHSFPDLTFYIKDLSVVGVDTFKNDTLASFDKLALDIDLTSVLGDKIQINSISVEHPVIKAIVLKNGKANWDIAKEDTTATEDDTDTTSGASMVMHLQKLNITDADISYFDYEGDMSSQIKGLSFDLTGDFSSSNAIMNMAMKVASLTFNYEGVDYLKKAKADFTAKISADLDSSKYVFEDNKLLINDLPVTMNGYIAMPTDDILMNLKITSKGNFKKLMSLVPSIYMSGYENVTVKGNFDFDMELNGTYNDSLMPAYDMDLNVNNGYIKYPDLPEDIKNINLALNIHNKDSIDLNKTIVNLSKFHLEIAGNPVDARLVTSNVMVDPYIDAFLKTHLDLTSLKKAIPLDSTDLSGIIDADVSMKGKMSSIENEQYDNFYAEGSLKITNMIYKSSDEPVPMEIKNMLFEFSPKAMLLKDFYAKAGNSDISANGQIFNVLQYYFKDSLLKGTFNLSSNLIDANMWLTGEETTEDTTTQQQTDTSALEIIEVPKNIDFTLNSDIKKLYYDKYKIENLKGKIIIKNGEATLQNLSMDIFGGNIVMTGKYSTMDMSNPFVKYSLKINKLDLNKTYSSIETLQKVAPLLKNASGQIYGKMEIETGLLQDMSPKMETMNGLGNIQTKNFVLKENGLFKFMNSFFKTDKFKEIKTQNTNLTIKIENGKISFDPFDFSVGNIKAHASGEQYVDGKLNYTIEWDMPKNALGSAAVSVMNKLASQLSKQGINANIGNTIKVKTLIQGTLDKPKYKALLGGQGDNQESIQQQVKDKVKEELNKKKQEAIQKAKEQAAKLLAEANRKAQQIKNEAHKKAQQIREGGKNAAKQIRDEAKRKGDELVKKAKNPIAKKAAEISAQKLQQEADKKAKKVEQEANSKADKLEQEANKRAKQVVDEAKSKGNELIKKAENS